MTDRPRLYLIASSNADAGLLPRLEAAMGAGDIACVLLPEGSVAELKPWIETVQARDAAALVRNDASLAAQADGVHLDSLGPLGPALHQLRPARIVGVGGLALKDDAMTAGEAGADYVLFGEASSDGTVQAFADRLDRVSWWADIFQVPCVAVAHEADEIRALSAAGADFVALPAPLWAETSDPARAIQTAMTALEEGHRERWSEQV